MSLSATAKEMQQAFGPWLEAIVCPGRPAFGALLAQVSDVRCTPEEFMTAARQLGPDEARTLLTATLHRSMAYSSEILSLEEARRLASKFVAAAGEEAEFYSTCEAEDEVSGVGSWQLLVTSHTFESVLYCKGPQECALLVAVDED